MKFLAVILVVLVVPSAIAQDAESPSAYLCIPDMATGFIQKDGKWQSTSFDISDNKYIFRRPKEGDPHPNAAWLWAEFGTTGIFSTCEEEANESGFVYCDRLGGYVFLNLKVLKYQLYERSGYVVTDTKYNGTPNIEIGKCSPL
jgi:hypothetical protein